MAKENNAQGNLRLLKAHAQNVLDDTTRGQTDGQINDECINLNSSSQTTNHTNNNNNYI